MVYVGDKPVRAYEEYAVSVLRQAGTATLLARGANIGRTIYIAWRTCRDFPGTRIVDEHSYLERLPFRGPDEAEERMRDVPVYSVTIVVDEAAFSSDSELPDANRYNGDLETGDLGAN